MLSDWYEEVAAPVGKAVTPTGAVVPNREEIVENPGLGVPGTGGAAPALGCAEQSSLRTRPA